jgi:hypothetical protein
MDLKIAAVIFLALGSIFMSFSNQVAIGIRWINKSIWNEQRRKQFPGHGGTNITPGSVVLLGASWVFTAIIFWLAATFL